MRRWSVIAALLFSVGTAGNVSGQVLSLEFQDGRVKLTAENVPVSRILAEWARVGGTQIVNGERIPGAPVSLELVDTPERQALEIVLRSAAGYMVLARDASTQGASVFSKIMVLPTTSRAAAAAPPPAPPAPIREPDAIDVDAVEPDQGAPPNFPRRRLPPNLPPGAAQVPEEFEEIEPEDEAPPPPATGNPFGVVPGGVRPGTINTPPPRVPGAGEQPPQ